MPSYETADGQALLAVEGLCRSIATADGFSGTTKPTLGEVQRYRDMAYYKIAGALVNGGYAAAQTDADVLGFLQNLQVIEMVILVELSRPIITTGVENTRFEAFIAERERLYTLIMSGMLDSLGAGALSIAGETGFVEVTGISLDRKQGIAGDGDLVRARFRRGQFAYPGSDPSVTPSYAADVLG